MIPELRQRFNRAYTPARYQEFLTRLNAACGVPIEFRVSETPCFLPEGLVREMSDTGIELVRQLVESAEYRKASDATIPARYHVPREARLPLFVQVDFGLVRGPDGALAPRLVELQAFPSLYGYQPVAAALYRECFGLPEGLGIYLSGLDEEAYWELMRRVIVGDHAPENVVLLEVDPQAQKTLPDFKIHEQRLGITTVDIRGLMKQGRRLHHVKDGRLAAIERIYNRCIVDELERKGIALPFDLRDDLDVEWAGHPNWYFRISKFSIPFLKHACVPRTWFLDELETLPADRENYLLKPLYSFAGVGIKFAPTDAEIAAIPARERHNYILQERVNFAPVIETPHGATQMEVRIMYVWPEGGELTPVLPLLRMGRGKMMGVDHNKGLEWVGGSAGLIS
jgi:hypothetical protein